MSRKSRKSSRASKTYGATAKGLFNWANSELEHVGRIAAMQNSDLQYAYAMSTLNGMAHLKDAIYEYITTEDTTHMRSDLKKVHDKVVRVMKHLVRVYKLNVQDIIDFNTRHTLSNLSYLTESGGRSRTRKSQRGGLCPCMFSRRNGGMKGGNCGGSTCMLPQVGGDGLETTDYSVQGVPTTKDENSVVVIGNYGPVTAKEFRQVMEDREAGRLD